MKRLLFLLTLLVWETSALQLLYSFAHSSKVKHYTHTEENYNAMLSRNSPVGQTSLIKGFHSIYLRLYSSLSLFTLARTL